MSNVVKDLTGKTFGSLVVLERGPNAREGTGTITAWHCKCKCGKTVLAKGKYLLRGKRKSCGCLERAARMHFWNKSDKKVEQTPYTSLFSRYRNDAKIRGHSFKLTTKDFQELVEANCFFCNCSPSRVFSKKYGTKYNGIDRWDNEVGYERSNCVTACYTCNKAKGVQSGEEFFEWIVKIHKHITVGPESN